jgi:hypothetical protein
LLLVFVLLGSQGVHQFLTDGFIGFCIAVDFSEAAPDAWPGGSASGGGSMCFAEDDRTQAQGEG